MLQSVGTYRNTYMCKHITTLGVCEMVPVISRVTEVRRVQKESMGQEASG